MSRSLEEMSLSMFNIGGSRAAAPNPRRATILEEHRFDDMREARVQERVQMAQMELLSIQKQSNEWKNSLIALEGAVTHRASKIKEKDARLSTLLEENEKLVQSLSMVRLEFDQKQADLQGVRSEFAHANTELNQICAARDAVISEAEGARSELVRDTKDLHEVRRSLVTECDILKAKRNALQQFLSETRDSMQDSST